MAKLKERPCQKMGTAVFLSLPRVSRKSVVRTGIEHDYNMIAKVDHPKLGGLWELSLGEIEGSRAARSTWWWVH